MRITALASLLTTFVMLAPLSFAGPQAGDQAPDFSLPTLPASASVRTPADFAGKVVYLDFWASWCGPCRVSLPALNRIYADLKDRGLEVVAINVDEVEEDAEGFLERFPVDYTLLADPAGGSPQAYGILGMPTAFYIDRKGVIRGVHAGFRKSDEAEVREKLLELLEE